MNAFVHELGRLSAPLGPLVDRSFRWLPLWLGGLLVAWALSGITVVEPNEVALVLRFGSLQGAGTAQAVHPPGLLFAPPKPFGEVIRVPTRTVFEVELRQLHLPVDLAKGSPRRPDPRSFGHVLTGDRNVLHVAMVARYQIADPEAFVFAIEDPETVLSAVVAAEMVDATGRLPVDAVLTDGRADLIRSVMTDAQKRLDALEVGLALVNLELIDLTPPAHVKADFTAVQSASIEAETLVRQAEEYRTRTVPLARSERDTAVSDARATAATLLSSARGDAGAFRALADEYAQNPGIVRERLYREGVEEALADAKRVRFLPPPTGSRYDELRISVK